MPSVFAAASLPLLGSLLWAIVIVAADRPWREVPAVLLAADLVLLGTVTLVGIVLGRSRWARRLGIGVSGVGLAFGALLPPGTVWVAAVVVSAAAIAGMMGPWLKGWVRERPAALGPPSAAVNLELMLLAVPGIVGAAAFDGAGSAAVVGALAALPVAIWYGRTGPGAVVAVRVVYPTVAIATGLIEGAVPGVVLVALGLAVASLAWTPHVRLAARPLTRRGHPVPIPPELTPPEVLKAAGLDDRGRRRPR